MRTWALLVAIGSVVTLAWLLTDSAVIVALGRIMSAAWLP